VCCYSPCLSYALVPQESNHKYPSNFIAKKHRKQRQKKKKEKKKKEKKKKEKKKKSQRADRMSKRKLLLKV
jgi:hypothetical protein